ncbi:MAG: alpha/beta hydrolase [Chloroflexi bacterium]|nr:alpha/beta hydrolase [Chloroflexota bacterium]
MLNYRIEGDGPPLLLIHGFGISFNIWQNLLPLLKEDFSLIMIELPGIGKSPAPQGDYLECSANEIEQLRRALKIERWHVFSYSSGTRVGERYVQQYSDHVIKAVYLCPAQVQWHKAFGLKIAKSLDARYPQIGNWVLSEKRLDFLIRLLGFNLRPSPHTQAWMDEISSQPVDILKTTIITMPRDGRQLFAPPPVPHMFIWGRQDLITASPRKASARHRLINAMHSAPVLEAEQVAELAIPFLSAF